MGIFILNIKNIKFLLTVILYVYKQKNQKKQNYVSKYELEKHIAKLFATGHIQIETIAAVYTALICAKEVHTKQNVVFSEFV